MARKKQKPYWEMTAAELAEATKQYDREIPTSAIRRASPKNRLLWQRAQGRPVASGVNGKGKRAATGRLLVKVDSELLEQANDYARKHDLTLSEVVDRSLRSSLSFAR